MKCTKCGGSNFNWVSNCDHCGHLLTADGGVSTSGMATPDPRVADVLLDLRKHALEDIPGKSVTVNGVSYTILKSSRLSRQRNVSVH